MHTQNAPDLPQLSPGLREALLALRHLMLRASGPDTAYDADDWNAKVALGSCPLTGHCFAAATAVQTRFGGDILCGQVGGNRHAWNRLPCGSEVDLTSSQFGGDGLRAAACRSTVVRERKATNPRFLLFDSLLRDIEADSA